MASGRRGAGARSGAESSRREAEPDHSLRVKMQLGNADLRARIADASGAHASGAPLHSAPPGE
eukprot:13583946-Alexandrium_andersonii.AAC.1